jgi:2-polyprenyl-3-methyl-5-hydroxy-6-metoxy-1,4-benzoquinol methylase
MSLAVRAVELEELMDDPQCDPDRLRATLRRFDTVNRAISGWGAVYRHTLGPWLRALGRPTRVLDIGSGGGDLVRRLARLAERDGLDVHWTGVDPDPRAHAVATERETPSHVEFRCTDTATLVSEGGTFDVVLSNHVLHHLPGAQLRTFADESLALATGIALHSDIRRSRLAYGLYAVGVTPFAPGTFLRTDGLRSIRRSYLPGELAAELGARWRVQSASPFRVVAIGMPGA